MSATSARRGALSTLAVGAIVVLAGCGPAPWAVGQPTGTPTPTVTTVVPPIVSNDLASGSTKRTLPAGSVSAELSYWSTLSMDKWTASALKPVSLSLTATVTPNDGQEVGLQRVTMVAVPGNATETFAPLEAQVDQSNQPAGYPVLTPYSYLQTVNVGALPAESTFVTLQFTYEFLVQTTPTSTSYAKQTATDSLTVAIVP